MDDEALSEVPREELEKKTKALIDFHKKYSTIGKKTTAQEKDPNRDKKTGFKPGSSFGSNIGYRTGKNNSLFISFLLLLLFFNYCLNISKIKSPSIVKVILSQSTISDYVYTIFLEK